MDSLWGRRSEGRIPDARWNETITRVRGEFEEMPCLRVTSEQARILFGLADRESEWVLKCLERDGFLDRTPRGEFIKRNCEP
jgi:hypothetical protein